MNRRSLLFGGLGTAVSSAVRAAQTCGAPSPLGTPCRVFVAQPAIIRQQCPEWCWAAAASMVFEMHGHPVNQGRIVAGVFGGLACASSQGFVIAQVLSVPWIDDFGNPFRTNVVAAYDFGAGVNFISNRFIIDELVADRPLLYGNNHHAMVVSQVDYFETPIGPNIQAVGVFVPWPYNPAFHLLTPAEMIPQHMGGEMAFLAAVHVA